MGPPDLIVIVNILGAIGAVLSFGYLARTKLRDARRLGVAGVILAACYVVGYVWFLGHPGSVAPWSSTMRSVSVVAWPVVWVAVPLLLARICRELLALNARASEALEDAKATPPARMTEEPPT